MPTSPSNGIVLRALQKETEVLRLRIEGKATAQEIGRAMGISTSLAANLLARARRRLVEEHKSVAEEERALSLARLDKLLDAWWPRAVGGKFFVQEKQRNPETGRLRKVMVEREVPPDLEAARFVNKLVMDRARVAGVDAGIPSWLANMDLSNFSLEDLDAMLSGGTGALEVVMSRLSIRSGVSKPRFEKVIEGEVLEGDGE